MAKDSKRLAVANAPLNWPSDACFPFDAYAIGLGNAAGHIVGRSTFAAFRCIDRSPTLAVMRQKRLDDRRDRAAISGQMV